MDSVQNKKFGLIIPKKKPSFLNKKPTSKTLQPHLAAFDNEDSSDDDGQKQVNSQIHKEALKKIVKKQTKLEIQKALEEDATVYEYDSIYDDMKNKANQKNTPKSVQAADKQKKPKYISSLMKAAEKRNRERQRIEERKIEKERVKEGDQFSDKPQFVTSAYRKRMQEREKEEEEERRMAAIEDAMDVRKQKDLSGFYKHLLRQQVGEEVQADSSVDSPANETPVANEEDRDTDLSFSSSSESEEETKEKRKLKGRKDRSRRYDSDSSSSDENHEQKTPDSRITRDDHSPRQSYDRTRDHDDHKWLNDSNRREYYDRDRSRHDFHERDRHHQKSDRSSHDHHERDRHNHRTSDRDTRRRRSRDRDERHQRHGYSPEPKRSRDSPVAKADRDHKHRDTNVKNETSNHPSAEHKTEKDEVKVSEKFAKRTTAESAQSARERYLARKRAAGTKRAPVASDSD